MDHPDIETLAAHVEGRLPRAETEALRVHLVSCRRCADLWADAAVFHVEAKRPAPRRIRRPRPRTVGATLAAAAALALAVGLGRTVLAPEADSGLAPELRTTLDQTRALASDRALVLPGAAADVRTPRYRDAGDRLGLAAVIAALREARDRSPRDPVVANELAAALLLDANAGAAASVVEEALRHHPEDRALRHSAAVVAFHRSELVEAEERLRALLTDDATDEVAALNLALVLEESGQHDEARERLEALVADADRPDVRTRARREISTNELD